MSKEFSVGEIARRAGVAVSALHFYEARGLIRSNRTGGNQRRYAPDVLRRVAIIQVGQEAGIPLGEIARQLDSLPEGRTPTKADWSKLSRKWRDGLDRRIRQLEALRDGLDDCIGCGCLSIAKCRLRNLDDWMAAQGPGARRLTPHDVRPAVPKKRKY